MKGLDKNSTDYAQKQEQLKNTIFAARVAKLALIDDSTLSGLAETKNLIQQIINDLKDPKEIEKWQNKLNEVNEKAYQLAASMANSGSLESLKKEQSALDAIINSLPEGSPELEKWIALWVEVTKKINDANKKIDDLKKGIEEGSVKKLQDEIKELQEQLTNKNLDVNARLKISKDITKLQKQVDTLTKGQVTIEAKVAPSYIVKGSDDDKRQSLQNAQSIINQINEDFNNGLITSREQAKTQVAAINEELAKLGLKPIHIHFESDFEKMMDKINDGFSNVDSIISTVDSIQSLSNAISEGASAWEIFKQTVSTVESVLSTVSTVMSAVNTIQQLFNTTKSASAAVSASETAATTAAATAQQGKAAVDTESVATTTAATVALKAQEAAYLDMAAAAIYAAHASIPFAGVGIASGLVSAMMAAMSAQHAATLAMAAFKDGGIVGGSSFYGDKVIARLNSGEMVLSKKQQTNLFNAIDNGMFGFGKTENATINFKLKGSDIYGSLKNFTNIKSKSSSIKGF